MSLLLARVASRIRKSLGGVPEVGLADIVNDAGAFLVAMYPWNWLQRQEAQLDFIKNQSFARLPFNFPRDVRHVESMRASTRNRTFAWGTPAELSDVRSDEPPAGAHRITGAMSYLTPKHPNLLKRTESLHEAAASGTWITTGTITPALASGATDPVHPVTGEKGVAKLTANFGASIHQDVAAVLLKNQSVYWASGYMRPDIVTPPTRSTVQLISPGTGVLRTCANITWGAVPTIALRLAAPVSAGAGLHLATLERLSNGWVRWALAITYDMVVDFGLLRVVIQPVDPDLGAETGKIVFATGPQLELIEPYRRGAALPDGPGPYRPTVSDEFPAAGAPVPVLELAPVPSETELGALTATFASGWPTIDNDSDFVAIPDWLNGYFLELCVEWARGIEEQDREPLSVRIANRMGADNPLLQAAIGVDMDMQGDLGTLRNGAVASETYTRSWEPSGPVGGPG